MTTEKAIEILASRGINNYDLQDDALEVLAFEARAFELLKNELRISAHEDGRNVILDFNGHSFCFYDKKNVRTLRVAFEL